MSVNLIPVQPGMVIRAACHGLILLICALSAGCSATVQHQRESIGATGIRYYESAPYLLVYSDAKGGLKWQIRYLPDQSRIMTATPRIVGGRTEMTLYFQNGMLASASTTGDTTELPKAIISAVQSALPLLAKGLFEGPAMVGFPAPYLYKIVVNGSNVSFLGGTSTVTIRVPNNVGGGS